MSTSRARLHSKDADAEQAAHRIQGTSQWSHRRAGSTHARERAERAAGSSSGQGEEAADIPGGSERSVGRCDLRGTARIRASTPCRHQGPKIC